MFSNIHSQATPFNLGLQEKSVMLFNSFLYDGVAGNADRTR